MKKQSITTKQDLVNISTECFCDYKIVSKDLPCKIPEKIDLHKMKIAGKKYCRFLALLKRAFLSINNRQMYVFIDVNSETGIFKFDIDYDNESFIKKSMRLCDQKEINVILRAIKKAINSYYPESLFHDFLTDIFNVGSRNILDRISNRTTLDRLQRRIKERNIFLKLEGYDDFKTYLLKMFCL